MKAVAKKDPTELDCPAPLDKFQWRTVEKIIIDKQAHERWGCMFYRFIEKWKDEAGPEFDGDLRRAGDEYFQVVTNFRRLQATDPDELIPEARDLALRRININKRKYRDLVGVLGLGRKTIDELIFEEVWPACERGHRIARDCTVLLRNYFFDKNRK